MAGRKAEKMTDVPERLSPELVLVSPDLAVGARAALPQRPWEAFLPAAPPAPVVAPPVPAVVPDTEVVEAPAPAMPAVAVVEAPAPAMPALATRVPVDLDAAATATAPPASRHPVGYPVPGPKSGQRAIALALFALAVVLALTIRPVGDGPTFAKDEPAASAPAPAPAPGAVGAAKKTPAPKQEKAGSKGSKPDATAPAVPARGARTSPKKAVSPAAEAKPSAPSGTRATRKQPVSTPSLRAAAGGYVYGSELRLFVASGGTTIAWFQAVTPCGSSVTIQRIPIGNDGTFSARRTVRQRGGKAVVRLSGRVVGRNRINGNLAAAGPGCDRVRRYAAVLS